MIVMIFMRAGGEAATQVNQLTTADA